jgi:hypothetical protein
MDLCYFGYTLHEFNLSNSTISCLTFVHRELLGTQAMGMDATPENVYNNLTGNPSFARACNFTQVTPNSESFTDIPRLRKLEQFDQIMTENGLWSEGVRLHFARTRFMQLTLYNRYGYRFCSDGNSDMRTIHYCYRCTLSVGLVQRRWLSIALLRSPFDL